MRRRRSSKRLLVFFAAAVCAAQNESAVPKLLWRAPREATVKDWTCGFDGCDQTPKAPFHFVNEDDQGTTPKLTVKDASGRSFSVKFGSKVVPECFSSRFVAAMGYFVEPSYFVGPAALDDASNMHRARGFVNADGSFERARFQLRDEKDFEFLKDQAWSLSQNPFRGTHEYAGLRVLMMLLSNWDAKDIRNGKNQSNTGVFRGSQGLFYSFFDWGSTLGRWGGFERRTRSDCSGYGSDTPHFIRGVEANNVQFGYSGKNEQDVRNGITVDDLRWLAPYLQKITDDEIRAGLQACGATPRQTSCWAGSLEARMKQIENTAARR